MDNTQPLIRIKDEAQCAALLQEAKDRFGRLVNNTPLMPDEISRYISLDKLFYMTHDHGIVFVAEERDFSKLFCYLEEDSDIMFLPQERTQVIETIQRQNRPSKWTERIVPNVRDGCMRPYVRNIRVSTTIADGIVRDMSLDQNEENYSLGFAETRDISTLYRIWEESLDIYDSILPVVKELEEWIGNREIVVIRQGDSICSAARMKRENKKTVSFWLVVTDSRFRHRGLGRHLYNEMMKIGEKQGYEKAAQWCDVTNAAVLKTIDIFGFEPDGYESVEYIIDSAE